ncbi:MAG: M6 family metalloprotease domain-containing protein, partial [Kiritimatiellaeota bacterium]|nr:M6 family metalloprotease domain-containing protein [Kiritimatiellota bacterium]
MSLFGSAVQCTGRVGRLLLALLALGLGWYADVARAVQADPEGREAVQPDGTKFTLHLRGDEFFSWHETEAGHAVVKDATDGFWKYAKPAADKAEFQALKDARVGSVDPARHGLKKHAMPDVTVLRKYVQERRRAILGQSVAQETNSSAAVVNQSVEPPPETPPEEPPQPVPVQGRKTVKNIVILACFSNHWDDVNNTVLPAYGRVDTNEYYNLFNQIGHTNDGAVGSVKDYYREISYGKLTIDSIIVKWVKLPREGAYYSNNRGGLAADAVAAAATAGFDFSLGDSNSDGWVDVLDVLHSGYGQESTSDTNDVWSCRGGMSSVVTNSGVKMYNYHTEPALRSSSGTGIERIGTICHETGHFFGLPDLYDYSPLTDGLGKWCLMSGASWNGSSGTSPGHPSAWAKVFLGFAKTVPVHSKTGLSLPRVEDNAVVGMLRDGTTNQEYFLIENRAKVGFDNSAQIYPGVLIYHVDQKNANNDLSTWPHPAVKIEEADGDNSLGSNTTDSEPGDAWTSTSGLSGGFRDQTGNTNTTAMLYQTGSLYSRANDAAFFTYNR